MNIVDPILFQCRRQPPVAAICVPGAANGLISYRRLETFVHNITKRLYGLGLPEKAIVAVNAPDLIFHIALLLALARLGMATLSLRQGEVSAPIKVDALITTTEIPFANMDRAILADPSWTDGDGRPLEPHLLPRTHEDDLCRLILTSGTTNTPKAVAVSHRLLASRMARHLTVFGNRLGDCSRIYTDVPISSSVGFQFLIYTLSRGGTIFFPGDDFQSTLRAFEDYKVQCLIGSPGAFETLLRWYDAVPGYQSNIEVMCCMGDVMSRSLSERLRSRICSHVIQAYGSTEASMSTAAHAHEIANIPRAVGFVMPGVTIQIIDEKGTILPPDAEGTVRIKSEYISDGYFRNPEESRLAFRDGWFYPGDLGMLNADGLFIVKGRAQTVLNLGGDKISPEAIELVLSQYPGVIEAAAFSAPNEFGNNEVCAVIASREPIEVAKLRAHCEGRLSRAFVPAKYYFTDSLPHNEMGKIDRRRVDDLVKQLTEHRS